MPHTARCEYRHVPSVPSTVRLSMSISEVLRWQWQGYSRYHQSRANLLIHIVAVPLFLGGTIALLLAVAALSLIAFALAVGCIVAAIALQGRGHRLEVVPPEPFSGPGCFLNSG